MGIQHMQLAGYRIQERIGMGGMGEVYKAYHPGLNRVAAIKILHQKELAERFKNEAYIQSSVNHPNIAKLYEYLHHGDTPCIIMEYVEGFPLGDYIARKGRLESEETEKILSQVASALEYLHSQDILHRDIKPQNFKIDKYGHVKMLDFGISKNKYTPKLTQLGFVVGTTEYMAPEQFQHRVEKKSDIWSLGVMTYEMLTGHLPFDSNNVFSLRASIIKASFTDPRLFVPDISEKLTIIIDRSLKVNPASRITASEIGLLLQDKALDHSTVSRFRNLKMPSKQQLMYAAGFIGFLLLVLFLSTKNNNAGRGQVVPEKQSKDSVMVAGSQLINMQIEVPGIPGAIIELADGSVHRLPHTLSGKNGERIDFTLKAEGYHDQVIRDFVFNHRRNTYAVNLQRKNN